MWRWLFFKGKELVGSQEAPLDGEHRQKAKDWIAKAPVSRRVEVRSATEKVEIWPKEKGQ
jgi:hypothetical protein